MSNHGTDGSGVAPPMGAASPAPSSVNAATAGAPAPGRPAAADPAGIVYLDADQARIVAAAAARIIPSDDNGPGATEAGVVCFIDRQLASGHGYGGKRYALGPFLPGEHTQGDQSVLSVRDRFRLGIDAMDAYAHRLYGVGFAALEPEGQDRVLGNMEVGVPETFADAAIQAFPPGCSDPNQAEKGATAFFEILRAYTIAGFFGDPVYGGNRDMVGWKLIGFPGANLAGYADQILNHGEPYAGGYRSLADVQGETGGGA